MKNQRLPLFVWVVILCLMSTVVNPISVLAQSGGFNPANPPEPGARFNISVTLGEGTSSSMCSSYGISTSSKLTSPVKSGQYASGTTIYVFVKAATNYQLDHWELNGEVYNSTSVTLTYKLDKDSKFVLFMREAPFDPANPSEPSGNEPHPSRTHKLTLTSSPADACTFKINSTVTSSADIEVNSSVTVATTPNSGFVFNGWYKDNVSLVSSNATYTFTMGKEDVKLTARYTFDPSAPDEPNGNQDDVAKLLLGDVNMNGRVDVADAVMLLMFLKTVGSAAYPVNLFTISDVNQDGKITTDDAIGIKNIYLRKQ